MRNYFKYSAYLLFLIGITKVFASSYVDFFRAVDVDNADGVQELLARGFDPNTMSEYGQTGLILAMREDSPKVAAVLLASPKIKIDATNHAGETALMMAALHGRLDWTRKLLERGAKVDREGWTPLHYAATGPNAEIVALLLDLGGRIDARAPNGNTPLMMAARFGDENNVKLLVQRGANKTLRNESDQTAADLAAIGARPWLLPLLR